MKRFSRSIKFAAVVIAVLFQIEVRAQNLTGTGYIDLKNGSWVTPNFTGNVFLWSPGNASLRVGVFDTDYWYDDSGNTLPNTAGGFASIAGGWNARAPGWGAIALGCGSSAAGDYSVALAGGSASGFGAIGVGGAASGQCSTAIMGSASGEGSFALNGGIAQGSYSTAFGLGSATFGESSMAIGLGAETKSSMSYSIGIWTITKSYGGFAIGISNLNKKKDGVTDPNPDQQSLDDPIFEIGAGSAIGGPNRQSNALTVYRDGTVRLHKAHGGISMGAFQ